MCDSHEMAALTFVTRRGDGRLDLWTPERPADYAAGNAMGRDYATEMLAYMATSGDASIFGAVVRAITRSGRYEAVEIGFCSVIGIQLLGVGKPVLIPDIVVPMPDAIVRSA